MNQNVDGDRRVYVSQRRQRLIAVSIAAIFFVTFSLVFEPDPSTGTKPVPSDYLWIVIPGAIMVAVLAWRALKAHVATDSHGITLVHTAGRDVERWDDVRGFEVHPTPGRQGYAVRLRRTDEGLLTVRNEIMVRPLGDRDEARRLARARAEALRQELETDRLGRRAASGSSGSSSAAVPGSAGASSCAGASSSAGSSSAAAPSAGATSAGATSAGAPAPLDG